MDDLKDKLISDNTPKGAIEEVLIEEPKEDSLSISIEEDIVEEVREDVLDEIFVDKNIPMDRQILVDILKSYVTIDNEGIINFTENYNKKNDNIKSLIYLACKKAKVGKEIIEKNEEAAGPKEISENAGISQGCAKVSLYRDFKKLLIKVEGGYIIPNYNLQKVKKLVVSNG